MSGISSPSRRLQKNPGLEADFCNLMSVTGTSNPDACKWLVDHFEDPLFRFFVCKHRDISIPKEALAALQKMADSDEPFIFGSGNRLLLKNEIVAP